MMTHSASRAHRLRNQVTTTKFLGRDVRSQPRPLRPPAFVPPWRVLEISTVSSDLQNPFTGLLDPDRMRPPHGLESAVAPIVLEPASVDELAEVVRKCERDRLALAPIGAGRTLRDLRANP